jgi:serine/threonine protein kinase
VIFVAADSGDEARDPLEELAADYAERLRRGERPSVADYQLRHPELAQAISEFFPTVAALEDLREPGVPETVGEYRLLRELGRGGMGAVFAAEQPSLQRRVAVKIMTGSDAAARARFQREARIAAGLTHPHILPVFACGEEQGTAWIAMQLVTGLGLDRVIAALAGGRIPPPDTGLAGVVAAVRARRDLPVGILGQAHGREVALFGAQAADALAHAHAQGVLHRDVKPANLLLGEDGRLWVADFGLAKAVADDNVTGTRLIAGTLRYTAPERFSGRTDARSDVYALGVTLFELLTLTPAFAGDGPGPVMAAIIGEGVPDPALLAPFAPPELLRVIRRACAKEPHRRQADATVLASELRAAADATGVTLPFAPPPVAQRRWWYVLLVALAIATVFAVLPLLSRPPRPQSESVGAPGSTLAPAPGSAEPHHPRPADRPRPPPPWDDRPPPEDRPPPDPWRRPPPPRPPWDRPPP